MSGNKPTEGPCLQISAISRCIGFCIPVRFVIYLSHAPSTDAAVQSGQPETEAIPPDGETALSSAGIYDTIFMGRNSRAGPAPAKTAWTFPHGEEKRFPGARSGADSRKRKIESA
jgi:hypothetical protein